MVLLVFLLSSQAAAEAATRASGRQYTDDCGAADEVSLLQGAAFMEKAGRKLAAAATSGAADDALDDAVFDLWAQEDSCCADSDEIVERRSGIVFAGQRPMFDRETDLDDGLKYWDLTSRSLEAKGTGTEKPEGDAYTHVFVLQWNLAVPSGTNFLSLVTAQDPASADTESCGGVSISGDTRTLGTFSRRSLVSEANGQSLRSSGFEIETRPHKWQVVAYTGQATSSYLGKTTFYMQDEEGRMSEVGESDRVCSGWRVERLGQHIGKLSRALMWDRVLSAEEIAALPSVLSGQAKARIAAEQAREAAAHASSASSTEYQLTAEQGSGSTSTEDQLTAEQGSAPSIEGELTAEQGSLSSIEGQLSAGQGSPSSPEDYLTAGQGSAPAVENALTAGQGSTSSACSAAQSAADLTDAGMEELCGDPSSYEQSRGPAAAACSGDAAETDAIKAALANHMFHWCGAATLYDTYSPSATAWQWHTNLDNPPRCWSKLEVVPASGELGTALEKAAAFCARASS